MTNRITGDESLRDLVVSETLDIGTSASISN